MRLNPTSLIRLLSPGGVYSFFNGLCPDNIFFNMVQGEVVKLELARRVQGGEGWPALAYCPAPLGQG